MTLEKLKVIISAETKGLREGVKNAKQQLGGMNKMLDMTRNKLKSSFTGKGMDNLNQKYARQIESIKKQQIEIDKLRQKYESLTSGETEPKKVAAMKKELEKVTKELDKAVEKNISLGQTMDALKADADLEKQAGGDYTPETKGKMSSLQNELSQSENLIEKLRSKAEQLKKSLSESKLNPSQSEEAQELAKKLDLATDKMQRLKNEAESTKGKMTEAGASGEKSFSGLKQSAQKASSGIFQKMSATMKRLKNIILGALVFNAVSQSFTKLREYMSYVVKTNSQLTSSLAKVKGNLLTAFQPIFSAVTPALQSMINWLAKATAQIVAFISAIFGQTYKQSQAAAERLNNQVDNLKEESKKAANAVMGFDELNIISKQKDSDVSGIKPDFSMDIDTSKTEKAGEKIREFAENVKESISEIINQPEVKEKLSRFGEAANGLKENVNGLIKNEKVKGYAKALVTNVTEAGIGWTTGFVDRISGGVKIISSVLGGDLKGVMDGTGLYFKGFCEQNEARLTALLGADMVDDIKSSLQGIGGAIANFWSNNVTPWFTAEKWSSLWNDAKTAWETGWSAIGEWWNNSTLVQWWSESVSPWFTSEKWSAVWNDTKNWWSNGWNDIKKWWNDSTLGQWWGENVSPWFTTEKWSNLWTDVKSAWSNGWNSITDWWNGENGISAWFENNVKPWFTTEKWSGILSGVTDGIKNGFKSAANAVIDTFENMVNSVIGLLNKISFDLPDFLGGGHVGFNLSDVNIEGFASGGFPRMGELFVAREAGPEMVGSINGKTAVANNSQIVSAVSTGVAKAVSSVMGNGESKDISGTFRIKGDDLVYIVDNARKRKGTTISKNFSFGGR